MRRILHDDIFTLGTHITRGIWRKGPRSCRRFSTFNSCFIFHLGQSTQCSSSAFFFLFILTIYSLDIWAHLSALAGDLPQQIDHDFTRIWKFDIWGFDMTLCEDIYSGFIVCKLRKKTYSIYNTHLILALAIYLYVVINSSKGSYVFVCINRWALACNTSSSYAHCSRSVAMDAWINIANQEYILRSRTNKAPCREEMEKRYSWLYYIK